MADILEVFYRGSDNGLWTLWRSPDGTWSKIQPLYGVLAGNPFVIQIPGTILPQAFWRGSDNQLWTRWRSANGDWSDQVALGGVLAGDPCAIQIVGGILQVFYRGADNALWTNWRKPDGSWFGQVSLGGVINGDPVAQELPDLFPPPGSVTVFVCGSDNNLWCRTRNGASGAWSGWENQDVVSHLPAGWPVQPTGPEAGLMGSKASVIQIQGTGFLQVCFQGYGEWGWAVYAGFLAAWLQVIALADAPDPIPFGNVPFGSFCAGKPFVINVPNTYPQMTIAYYRGQYNALSAIPQSNSCRVEIQNWCTEMSFGTGNMAGDPFVAYVPNGGGILQAFYRGDDNALWTGWGNAYELTAWPLQSLGGSLGGDPFVITVAEL